MYSPTFHFRVPLHTLTKLVIEARRYFGIIANSKGSRIGLVALKRAPKSSELKSAKTKVKTENTRFKDLSFI